jgi:hypothetical protein
VIDHGNKAHGLAFRPPDDLIEVHQKIGVDLPRFNGDSSWRLSIPVRIVVRREGIVSAALADPDYPRRAEVEATLEVLRRLYPGAWSVSHRRHPAM